MSIKIKSKKQLKREQVIPFSGEENFIVPRKGGYGMSDNEDYITVARPNYSDNSYSNLLKATDESGDELLGGGSSSGGGSLSGGGSSLGGGGSSNGGSDYVKVDYAPRGEEGALPILGGGGGMGGVGQTPTVAPKPGNGGIGTNSYLSWATITGTGIGGYYCGGGGGGISPGTYFADGGAGGGGRGASGDASTNAVAGTANTGGGGGGGGGSGSRGQAGGSGLIIVRYPLS